MSHKLPPNTLILGYYPLRGKIQICRLLCQYLHVPYIDFFFSPHTWQQFKATYPINSFYQQLPFLKDGEIVVTESYPICLYILFKTGRRDLLGITVEDQARVDMFVWETEVMCQVYSILMTCKNQNREKKREVVHRYWQNSLKAKFVALQQYVTDTYYLSYMTVVDFFIYDIVYNFMQEFPYYLTSFPKLVQIYQRIAKIPEIVTYENSSKAVKQVCPIEYFQQWKVAGCKYS